MNFLKIISTLMLSQALLVSCSDKDAATTGMSYIGSPQEEVKFSQSKKVSEFVKKHDLFHYPKLIISLNINGSVQDSISKMKEKGGKVIYDPNFGNGDTIKFYVAELSPELAIDEKFLKGLDIKSVAIDNPRNKVSPVNIKAGVDPLKYNGNIPIQVVGVDKLRKEHGEASLGDNIIVGVIDTGVDASHPVFQDRVIFFEDDTDETLTQLKEYSVKTLEEIDPRAVIDISHQGKSYTFDISGAKEFASKDVLMATIMDEEALVSQLSDSARLAFISKDKTPFMDVNYNGSSDKFAIIAFKDEDGTIKALIDKNGDMKLSEKELTEVYSDFNQLRGLNSDNKNISNLLSMVDMSGRNNFIKHPVLFNESEDGKLESIEFGLINNGHGTHVAGIMAANSKDLKGSVPKAKIMSLKVCSGLTCTDSAILMGLINSFYNAEGVIPDVVNISLGSREVEQEGFYHSLFQDLSAKFGTIFFISASNDGPGYSSTNNLGKGGPIVLVGAGVSKSTLLNQYNLDPAADVAPINNLFFSSAGPSYTGELKPNIVAPGGAISSFPMNEGIAGQANGTSMSSPLAAGAVAAMISVMKNGDIDENISAVLERRADKIKEVQAKEIRTDYSSIPFVLGMRSALELGATKMENMTIAQQGYGMLNVVKSLAIFKKMAKSLKEGSNTYFNLRINDQISPVSKDFKIGFDRSGRQIKVKEFALSLDHDGERPKTTDLDIINTPLKIELVSVEEQDSKGNVKVLNKVTAPIGIMNNGQVANQVVDEVVLSNGRKKAFYSRRDFSKMKEGYSYAAHYKISYKGAIVSNIVDLVQKPYQFPNIADEKIEFKAVPIKANTFHRYPVLIEKRDHELNVTVKIPENDDGRLYVTLYNQYGFEVGFDVVQKSVPHKEDHFVNVSFPIDLDSTEKDGIWEVTVSSSSSDWLKETMYNIELSTTRSGVEVKKLNILKGQTLSIPIYNEKAKSISTTLNSYLMETVKVDKVMAGYWSYTPINIPWDKMPYGGPVRLDILDIDKISISGRLVGSLFVKETRSNTFKKVKSSLYTMGSTSTRIFNVDASLKGKKLYFAYETYFNIDTEKTDAASLTSSALDVDVVYLALPQKVSYKTNTVRGLSKTMDVFNITAPKTTLKDDKRYSVKTLLSIYLGDDQAFVIPINLK